jgi:hypothetical protein
MWKFIGKINLIYFLFILCILGCDTTSKEIKEDIKVYYIGQISNKVSYEVYIKLNEYFKKNEFSFKSIAKSLNIKDSLYSITLCTEWNDDYPETGCSDCCLIEYTVENDNVISYIITISNFKGPYRNNLDWDKFIDCNNCFRSEDNDKYPKGYRMKRIINKVVVDSI